LALIRSAFRLKVLLRHFLLDLFKHPRQDLSDDERDEDEDNDDDRDADNDPSSTPAAADGAEAASGAKATRSERARKKVRGCAERLAGCCAACSSIRVDGSASPS
jgi:hypothetical protein